MRSSVRIKPPPDRKLPWFLRMQRRPLLSSKVWGRSPRLLLAMALFWRALCRKRSPISHTLRALVCTRVSQLHRCAFCIDLQSALLSDKERLSALDSYEESPLFSQEEKLALEYAERIFHQRVDDPFFAQLRERFTEDQLVELTGLIAFQTCSSTFNVALDIPAQGFYR